MTPSQTPEARPEHRHQSFAARDACPECLAAMAAALPAPSADAGGEPRARLNERLPVTDTPTKSATGIDVTLAVHFGTRADLIDSIVEIAAPSDPPTDPDLRAEVAWLKVPRQEEGASR